MRAARGGGGGGRNLGRLVPVGSALRPAGRRGRGGRSRDGRASLHAGHVWSTEQELEPGRVARRVGQLLRRSAAASLPGPGRASRAHIRLGLRHRRHGCRVYPRGALAPPSKGVRAGQPGLRRRLPARARARNRAACAARHLPALARLLRPRLPFGRQPQPFHARGGAVALVERILLRARGALLPAAQLRLFPSRPGRDDVPPPPGG
mmetsp:Transcript_5589/g.18637  ORF Transcript_5589/g.18637 Transcript_5589/m.18637 type:complete len:207 (+) Transcript_5589:754-1374(+)